MVRSSSRTAWRSLVPYALPVTLLVSALSTAAQQAPTRSARPDPLDAKAGVPATTYESSFTQYRRLGEEKVVSWREANDNVARIGGWRVYAREAQQPDPAPAAAPAAKPAAATPAAAPSPKPAPMPAGHGGHKMP